MRVLTTSVLVMQAITLGLAIPVAVVAGGQPAPVGWVLAGLAVACLLLPGWFGRPGYLMMGRALQVAVIACGVVQPMLFVLGIIFAALWAAAEVFGRRADAARQAAAGPAAGSG